MAMAANISIIQPLHGKSTWTNALGFWPVKKLVTGGKTYLFHDVDNHRIIPPIKCFTKISSVDAMHCKQNIYSIFTCICISICSGVRSKFVFKV